MVQIPEYIKINVYWTIDENDKILFNEDEMQREFDKKLEELRTKNK